MSTTSQDRLHWHPTAADGSHYRLNGSPLAAVVTIRLTLGGWKGDITRKGDGKWWKFGPFKNRTAAQRVMRKHHDRALLGEWPHDLYLVPDIKF